MNKVLCKSEDGLKVVDIKCKGRGVVSTRIFKKDDFLCEYAGECISFKEAKSRENEYLKCPDVGSYMYYFTFDNKKLWY